MNDKYQVRDTLDNIIRNQPEAPPVILEKKPKNKSICCFWTQDNLRRGNWSGRLEFLVCTLGYCIGLGNVWRFPYLFFKNGGVFFLIPFIIFLLFAGIPLILLEFTLGQFTSRGVLNCWAYAPLFRGIGVGMMLVSAMIAIYHNALTGYGILYLFKSMASPLPWAKCPCKSDKLCAARLLPVGPNNCTAANGLTPNPNGLCYDRDGNVYGIYNATAACVTGGMNRTLPSYEYMQYEGWMTAISKGLHDLQYIRWDLALSLLLAWVLVFLFLIRGIKTMGKVAYVTLFLPLLLLLLLLIIAATTDGSSQGLNLLVGSVDRLKDWRVWCEAMVAVFYMVGICWGGLITLASFNRFHTDIIRYSIIIPLVSLIVYILVTVMFYAFLGIVMKEYGSGPCKINVTELINSSIIFSFVIVPQGIVATSPSTLWAILYFLFMVLLGLGTVMVTVLTIVVAITDSIRRLRGMVATIILTLIVCIVFFLLGLTMTTVGGLYMLQLLDDYVIWWSILLLALILIVSLAIYGPQRQSLDIEVMVRKVCCCCIPCTGLKWPWIVCWLILTPIALVFTLVICLITYKPSWLLAYMYPTWANILGWIITISIVLIALIAMIICALMAKCRKVLKPTIFWGPAVLKNRKHITYVEGFVVDPKENQEIPDNMKYDKQNGYSNNVYENDERTNL